MKSFIKKIKFSNSLLFFLLSFINFLIVVFIEKSLDIDKLYYLTLKEKLNQMQLDFAIDFRRKWQWASYFFIPLLALLKINLISSVLYVGTFFYSKTKITFKQLFSVVVKAEFVFLGVGVLKIVWFYFFQTNYTLEDLQYFYPLSALNIVGYKGLEVWFVYPFQVLNLFELAYWLILAYFIGKLAFTAKDKGKPMDLGLKIVASSYGSALLLWVVVVMFFTLNYS